MCWHPKADKMRNAHGGFTLPTAYVIILSHRGFEVVGTGPAPATFRVVDDPVLAEQAAHRSGCKKH
jgi:hypothetical protein